MSVCLRVGYTRTSVAKRPRKNANKIVFNRELTTRKCVY